MSMDPEKIRKGDTVSVVTHVAANPAGKILAWRFLRQNWDEFKRRYAPEIRLPIGNIPYRKRSVLKAFRTRIVYSTDVLCVTGTEAALLSVRTSSGELLVTSRRSMTMTRLARHHDCVGS